MIPPVESPDEPSLVSELEDCMRQLDEIDLDAGKLVAQLSDNQFHWSPASSQWSVAQCLLHLVIFNRRYLPNIDETIERAWAENMWSLGPFHYGFVERWFIR